MRVWVSGAHGRLGRAVCAQLAAAGHEVVAADVTGPDPVDLLDRSAVARSLAGCDAIIHAAGIPSPADIEPVDLVRTNVLTTFNALEEAHRAGCRLAVLASSGSIWGSAWSDEVSHRRIPVDETNPLDYVDPYAFTKDVLERAGQMYARRGMTVTALRFHWILDPDEVRTQAAGQTEEEGVKNLWGYVDREDAARACVLALSPRPGTGPYTCLVIAAADTTRRTPTRELLARHLPDIEVTAIPEGTAGCFDCSRARDVLGWEPRASWR